MNVKKRASLLFTVSGCGILRRPEEYMEEIKKFRKGEVIFKEGEFQL